MVTSVTAEEGQLNNIRWLYFRVYSSNASVILLLVQTGPWAPKHIRMWLLESVDATEIRFICSTAVPSKQHISNICGFLQFVWSFASRRIRCHVSAVSNLCTRGSTPWLSHHEGGCKASKASEDFLQLPAYHFCASFCKSIL
jgi:hypothetical protein